MEVKQTVTILGAKGFKGEVEGTKYDSTTLYVLMDVSERAGTEVGQNVQPMKFGKEEEFQKIKALPFPIQAELVINFTTKGPEILAFKPIGKAQAIAPQ